MDLDMVEGADVGQYSEMTLSQCNGSCTTGVTDKKETSTNISFSPEERYRLWSKFIEEDRFFSVQEEVPLIVVFAVLSFFGLVGNSAVFWVILRKGCKQSSRNWYILNLACSDILTSVICNPLTVVKLMFKNWFLGEFLCKTVTSMQTLYVAVSTFTLVALALDRYSSIIKNNHQKIFKCRVMFCLCFIWTASICFSTPMIIVHQVTPHQLFNGSKVYFCSEVWQNKASMVSYTGLTFLLQYLSPLIAIVILHTLIGNFLGKRFTTPTQESININRKRHRHRKNVILLISMAVSFGVCWLPLHVVNAVLTFHITRGQTPFQGWRLMYALSLMVALSSVCLNPIVYGLFNSNFRRDLILMCGGTPVPPRFSLYTDFTRTRRSSPVVEHLGLITSTPLEVGISSNCNMSNKDPICAL